MVDVNKKLRQAYISVLSPLNLNIYNKAVSSTSTTLQDYVLITTQQNIDASTINSQDVIHTITLQIVSKRQSDNDGEWVDSTAGSILNLINPNPFNSAISASGFQVLSINLESDITLDGLEDGYNKVITRNLIFSHIIHFN